MVSGCFLSRRSPEKETPFGLIDPRQRDFGTRLMAEASIVRSFLADGSIEEEPPIDGGDSRVF
jgi:hypothetical protein